jgi:hypothetical protein
MVKVFLLLTHNSHFSTGSISPKRLQDTKKIFFGDAFQYLESNLDISSNAQIISNSIIAFAHKLDVYLGSKFSLYLPAF